MNEEVASINQWFTSNKWNLNREEHTKYTEKKKLKNLGLLYKARLF